MKGSFTRMIILHRRMHFMSKIYRPVINVPQERKNISGDKLSKSFKLMLDNGLIRISSCTGAYHLLPLGQKSLDKLIQILDKFLDRAGCQKFQMPILTSERLLKLSGRLDECKSELMMVSDRHAKSYALSPTHEESVCDLLNCFPISYRHLPLKLYQITEKFRDEMRPRHGLIRSRQFLMKDLYVFDTSKESALSSYEEISNLYSDIFKKLDLSVVRVRGAPGMIGGDLSHEFHLISEVGEDTIVSCGSCNFIYNAQLTQEECSSSVEIQVGQGQIGKTLEVNNCISCGSKNVTLCPSIEVAHTFLLGSKYTNKLRNMYVAQDGKPTVLEMSCYGIGVSRLLSASLEVLSSEEEMRWPKNISPYFVCVIPPKAGSKEEKKARQFAGNLTTDLDSMFGADLLVDDRQNLTVGKRLTEIRKLGIPYICVLGRSLLNEVEPLCELHDLYSKETHFMTEKQILKFLYDAKSTS